MNNYYYDPKANKFYGPLDRMLPVWDYGFPPDGPSDSQLASAEADYDDAWKSFNAYLHTLPSHPHTFTGESRVVPEGEIEWRYEVRDLETSDWKECTHRTWWKIDDDKFRRAVATPKITGEPSIPAHIVDDMKLDSYYDGFKDGANLTGEPATQAPGYTSSSGEEVVPTKCEVCGKEGGGHYINCTEHFKGYIGKAAATMGIAQSLFSPNPLTAQPDKPNRYEYGNISEYLECYGDYVLRGTWNLPADFIAVNPPPSPTPGQGEDDIELLQNAAEENAKKHYHNLSPYQAMVFGYIAGYKKRDADPDKKPASTHVRSQQQREAVAKDAILDILDDVLDTEGSDELGYWIDRQSKEKAAEMIKKLYDPALFSGSQASNQSEGGRKPKNNKHAKKD